MRYNDASFYTWHCWLVDSFYHGLAVRCGGCMLGRVGWGRGSCHLHCLYDTTPLLIDIFIPHRYPTLSTAYIQIIYKQCSHTLPRMKFPTFSLLFPDLMAHILHEIVWNLFTYRGYVNILDTRELIFLNNLVLSVVKYPPFCFRIELYFPHLKTCNSLYFPDSVRTLSKTRDKLDNLMLLNGPHPGIKSNKCVLKSGQFCLFFFTNQYFSFSC